MALPLNIDWQQILLHVFNFVILTGGLYFLLYNPIRKFIEKREEHYRKMEEEANTNLESAKKYNQDAKALFDGANAAIKEKNVLAKKELDNMTAARIVEAEMKAEKIINDAKKEAEDQRRAILSGARKEIIEITKETAARLVSSDTEDAYRRFLETAEKDLGNDE